MNNNDIIRRIRYTFDFNDSKMIEIFGLAEYEVTRAEISDWLKKEEDPSYQMLNDVKMSIFLNGLIIAKRGKKEGEQPKPEKRLNNNIIFRKLKIALNLKDEDIIEILKLVDFENDGYAGTNGDTEYERTILIGTPNTWVQYDLDLSDWKNNMQNFNDLEQMILTPTENGSVYLDNFYLD